MAMTLTTDDINAIVNAIFAKQIPVGSSSTTFQGCQSVFMARTDAITNTQMPAQGTQLNNLATAVSGVNTAVGAVNTAVGAVNTKVTTLQNTVDTNGTARLDALQSSVDLLTADPASGDSVIVDATRYAIANP
ncbi:hypothetical protein [Actinoplanes sp. URMC 104]|uniref:hypothetical protein n=1 Tax=Actinoplanes sp. URMC 104 TaxID=3423409 RepID=UPI003F1D5266